MLKKEVNCVVFGKEKKEKEKDKWVAVGIYDRIRMYDGTGCVGGHSHGGDRGHSGIWDFLDGKNGTRCVYGIFGAGIKSRSGCGIFKDAAASEHRYDLRGAHVRDRKTYGRKNDDIF